MDYPEVLLFVLEPGAQGIQLRNIAEEDAVRVNWAVGVDDDVVREGLKVLQ
jgi:hypothetical protein